MTAPERSTRAAAQPASGRAPHTGCRAQEVLRDKTAACAASAQRTLDMRARHTLDDPLGGDVEEMPVDHGNEGLKLVARAIRAPTIP